MRELQVLGTGCPACRRLLAAARTAADAAGIEYRLTAVTNLEDLLRFDVLALPALVVDGTVMVQGRLPTAAEWRAWLAG